MGFESAFLSDLAGFWPVLAVGFIVFGIWYAGKSAARSSGYHFGLLGVAVVFLAVAVFSWLLHIPALAVGLGLIGILLVVVSFGGSAR